MRKIIYYVACSLDGFIAGENENVSQFIYEGNGVEKYQNDLKEFDTVVVLEEIEKIQKKEGSDIYLCGGGQFAGWLLQNEKIDILKIKLNPILCGTGILLFGDSQVPYQLELLESESYEKGMQIMTYKILY